MNWSEEQVVALSPDDASTKSGKDLAKAEKWVSIHKSELALWGECKGSGSKPYQTQIDISNIAFKCSCPSRKFPCKHGLGLLLIYSRTPAVFTTAEQPAWVTEWLSKRANREEKKVEKAEKPVDEGAQAKRQQARQLRVSDGIDELMLWLKDIVRNGLLSIPEKSPSYWENMTKRMVDVQAPGLGRMVQTLGNTNFYSEHWQTQFLDQLLRMYLVMKGYVHTARISADLQEDIKSMIGFVQSQEELKQQAGITDNWFVLAKQTSDEGPLTTEKYWLYGTTSKQYALILQFIVNGQGRSIVLSPGITIQAELVYFPSVAPLRAIIKRQVTSDKAVAPQGFKNWKEVLHEQTRICSILPFNTERPFIVENIKIIQHQNKWWLADAAQELVTIKNNFNAIYLLLAVSAGEAVTLAVTGQGNTYEPIGAWINNNYYIL